MNQMSLQLTFSCEPESVCVNSLVFVEVFAGAGRLSAAVKKLVSTVSWVLMHTCTEEQRAAFFALTFCKILTLKILFRVLESPQVAAIHVAPPCSAASRARERKIAGGGPRPLRSEAHPDELRDLSPNEQSRRQLAVCSHRYHLLRVLHVRNSVYCGEPCKVATSGGPPCGDES